jgi:hypothetical protein
VLFGFCLLTGFTVGMFFLPACLALLVALLLTASRTGADLAPA